MGRIAYFRSLFLIVQIMLKNKNLLKLFFGLLILIAIPLGRAGATYDTETDKLLGIINTYRVLNGHAALLGDALLQNAANWMSEDMITHCVPNGFSCTHTDSLGRVVNTRFQAFGYPAGISTIGGEIIAWGSSGLSTADRAFNIWKNSAVHNENMLRDTYKAVGISRSCTASYCAWVVAFGGKVVQSFVYPPSPTPTPSPSSTPLPSSLPLPSPLPIPQNFPDGALIRQNGGIDVYIVKYIGAKKFKRLILSPSVFTHYGHLRWSDIRDIDQSVLDSFQTSDLVRAEGDTKVYKLSSLGDTGEKRWIPTLEIFNRNEFDWDSVYQINIFDRDSYLTGADWE